jgi:cytochrome c-type biogenesis protein CcmF
MYYFGTSLIAAAIVSALLSSALFIQVVRGRSGALRWARVGVYGTLVCAIGSAALILALFLLQRYDIRYVYDYSSAELELRYRIAATWAGQPGSLMVWAVAGLCAAPFLIKRTRHFEPYALSLLMLLQGLLLLFTLIRNPFSPTLDGAGLPTVPLDGRGLNPQLHNVWMVIHPPTLFVGYALLGVPFVMALAGLWRRDYDGWVRLAMPWTLAGWGVLGLALTMGGYWAYESLGWGGYWGWDPVENSSLVPWLLGIALLHGMLLQRTHGGLRRTNFVLAVLTYVAVFYASFLTRSGVLSNFSVHSFVEEGLKNVMIGTLVGLIALGVAMLGLRWRDVPVRRLSDSLLSRDTSFVLLIVAFALIALVVGVGTSVPWISSIKGVGYALQDMLGRVFLLSDGSQFGGAPLQDGRFSLTADFFERTTPPMVLVIVVLLGFGPLFGWGNTNTTKLWRAVRWPSLGAAVVTTAAIALGVRSVMSVAFVLLSSFAAGTNLVMIVRTLRSGWLRIGGYLAHVGMTLLLLGVVGSYAYASEDLRMVIPQGETQRAFGHAFTFWGYDDSRANGRHGMRLEVTRGNDTFIATPEVYYNERMSAWTRTPAIKRYLWEDLYISPDEYLPAEDPNSVTLVPKQEAKIGPYVLRFDSFDIEDQLDAAAVARIGASVTITESTTVRTVKPVVRMEVDKPFVFEPVDLGGGKQLYLDNFVPGAQQVVLRVQGLNIPIKPARAVLQVGVKPTIALVWLGALLTTLGCGMAVVRRRLEVPAHAPHRARRTWKWRGISLPRLRGRARSSGEALPGATLPFQETR